jgi:hypothetical protein
MLFSTDFKVLMCLLGLSFYLASAFDDLFYLEALILEGDSHFSIECYFDNEMPFLRRELESPERLVSNLCAILLMSLYSECSSFKV